MKSLYMPVTAAGAGDSKHPAREPAGSLSKENLYFRHSVFVVFTATLLAASFRLIGQTLAFSLANTHGSHIVLVPLVSAFLIYGVRQRMLANVESSWTGGMACAACGAGLLSFAGAQARVLSHGDYLGVMVAAVLLFWLGGFFIVYGAEAFKAARFPLLFLALVIPIPSVLLQRVIAFWQESTTDAVELVFQATRTPFYRQGFTFVLPGIAIEVAKECSGIRSGIALFITSLLAGHLFLRSAG